MKAFIAATAFLFAALDAPARELLVSAAISLKEALAEVNARFEKANPELSLELNLASSGALQLQIENGAPVDVFISAAPSQMDALQAKGLVQPVSVVNLLGNEIVLVAGKESPWEGGFSDLISDKVRQIAIGDPKSVPAGHYAQEVLCHFKMLDEVRQKLVFAKSVRQALTYAETGDAQVAIVYATDAKGSGKVKILATAPKGSHQPVIYPAAALKNARNPDAVRKYVKFLQGPEAGAIFRRNGFRFLPLEGPD